jgi:predicted GNAT family acetyltransferase
VTTDIEEEEAARRVNNAALISGLNEPPREPVRSDWDLDIVNDTERGRWLALLGADAIGELTYRYVGGRVVLLSTWVNSIYRNQRVASELISHALDDIRETSKTITIICPVIGEFIAHNPRYLDLIDEEHPGTGAEAARNGM